MRRGRERCVRFLVYAMLAVYHGCARAAEPTRGDSRDEPTQRR